MHTCLTDAAALRTRQETVMLCLGIQKQATRILVGLLTTHIKLNRHLSVMKIWTDPLCPASREEVETSYHLLGNCCAYILVRHSIMGAHLARPEELGNMRP